LEDRSSTRIAKGDQKQEANMAKKTEQVKKPSEEKTNKKTHQQNEGEQVEPNPLQVAGLLALQQTVGNRAVDRLIRSRAVLAGHPASLPPQNISAGIIQLLRNGTVGGVHYEENPRDTISIRMRYQVESFEAILNGVNSVVGLFGSDRPYADDQAFQSGLTDYLTSINHPAARGGGHGMSRDRWLRFRVRLVRGAGRRIDAIEFLEPFESVTMGEPEIEVEQPEPEGEAAPAETRTSEAGAPPQGAAASTAVPEAAATAEGGEQAEGWASRIAGGLEWLGDLSSGRWVWNPISSQMAEWEAELDRIGERHEGGVAGQVMLVPVTLLFTILTSITGTLDLVAQLNPTNLAFQGVATGIRTATGQYTQEQFLADAEEIGTQALDMLLLGLRNAYFHLSEGIREANVFRITQAAGEVALAAMALLGVIRGVRARVAASRAAAAAETVSGEAQAGAAAVPEAAATETTARPAGAAAETTARPGGTAAETPARPGGAAAETTARPAEPAAETTARPGETAAETTAQPAEPTAESAARPTEAPTSGESGFSAEFQRWMREANERTGGTFEEARSEWTARMDQEMGAGESRPGRSPFENPPHQVADVVSDAQARQMIRQWARGELDTPAHQYLSHEQFVYEYRESGGWGRPPAGFIDTQGVFRFDLPQSLGMPEIFNIRDQTQVRQALAQMPPAAAFNFEEWMDLLRQTLEERPGQPQGIRPAEPVDVNAATGAGEAVDVNAATGAEEAPRAAGEPVDVNAATGAGEAVDVNAATGEMEAPRAAEAAQPGEPASGEPVAGAPTRTMINEAAQQHGVQRVFYPEDVAEAQRFLEGVDRLNAPRMDLTPLGIRGRFARLVGMQAEVIAYLTDDGFFIYNKEVLSSPHSRP
jgi:hypothetical protein